MFKNIFKKTFLFIFLLELISLVGFLLPAVNKLFFFIIIIFALILAIKNLKFGLFVLFAELFIGSKGYLFFFEFAGIKISIRIALWLIIMSVWFGKVIYQTLKTKKNPLRVYLKSTVFKYSSFLFLFIGWGLISGFLSKNNFSDIFFDFNGWLFFAIIFPVLYVFKTKKDSRILANEFLAVFLASMFWLVIESYFLLYIFSHNMIGMISEIYRWIRITGVGEITLLQGGFYRVFFQSHIFLVIAFFLFLFLLAHNISIKKKWQWKDWEFWRLFSGLAILISVNILNFSRSNWVGLAAGMIVAFLYFLFKIGWKKTVMTGMLFTISLIIGASLLVVTVKFPYPDPTGGFSAAGLLRDRATRLSGEAALSSRWALFPKLWSKISNNPIIGDGFGATITYTSSDPRVLETSPSGEYTTYAFEWGWLDIWIKLGILGITMYIALILKIVAIGFGKLTDKNEQRNFINAGLVVGLIAMTIVSFFSPYMNHPLGIGFIVLIGVMIETTRPKFNIFNWKKR